MKVENNYLKQIVKINSLNVGDFFISYEEVFMVTMTDIDGIWYAWSFNREEDMRFKSNETVTVIPSNRIKLIIE